MPWSAHLVSPSYFSPFFPSFSYICDFFSIDLFIPVFGIYKPLFLRVMRKKWSTFQKICDLNQIIISLQPKPSGDSVQNPREITHLNIRHPCNGFISKVNPCSNCAHVNMKYIFFSLNLLTYRYIDMCVCISIHTYKMQSQGKCLELERSYQQTNLRTLFSSISAATSVFIATLLFELVYFLSQRWWWQEAKLWHSGSGVPEADLSFQEQKLQTHFKEQNHLETLGSRPLPHQRPSAELQARVEQRSVN